MNAPSEEFFAIYTPEDNHHTIFHLLPPLQMETSEPIRYSCSDCSLVVYSFDTQQHAESHGATSYEVDNIGLPISIDPTEHVTPLPEDHEDV